MSKLLVLFGLGFLAVGSHADTEGSVTNKLPEYKRLLVLENRPLPTNKDSVCYKVGCFNMSEPWLSESRPAEIPESPEQINTKFYYYTRKNFLSPVTIHLNSDLDLAKAKFDSDKKTAVLVGSFHDGKRTSWTVEMKDVYLQKVDANVMIVDWSGGSTSVNYFQAAANARVVGKELVEFIRHIQQFFGASPEQFHFICHGLGAHICSYVGKEIRGIGRLTALDPAQPYFEGFPSTIRLDKTDAKFVDVIHTNAKPFVPGFGFGMMRPYGDVDFYVNGGFDQPGCEVPMSESFFRPVLDNLRKYPAEVLSFWLHCDHIRAPYIFIEALNETDDCAMYGHVSDAKFQLDTLDVLTAKVQPYSTECTANSCIKMGFDTENSPLRGIYVVQTNEKSPYCREENWKDRGVLGQVANFLNNLKNNLLG